MIHVSANDASNNFVASIPNLTFGQRTTIASALQYISKGYFDEVPETIHEKVVHPMRLLVADHPFVDGNKRTAFRTTVVIYMLNGYAFEYGDEIRVLLHCFATDEAAVDSETAVVYFRACARRNA